MKPTRRPSPALLLILVLVQGAFGTPAWAQNGQAGLDAALMRDVFTSGLAFIAPRALDQVTPPQLAIWGLRGLTALDPDLNVQVTGDGLRLAQRDRTLLARPVPEASASGWGEAASELAAAAGGASPIIRRAGTQGVIQSFYDELFNHLDPYSRYEAPEPAEQDRDRRWGLATTGIELGGAPGAIAVRSVQAESPAEAAGVLAGERLLAVDGTALLRQDLATVTNLLAGPEDMPVTLRLRSTAGRVHEVTLNRTQLPPETVFSERGADYAMLRITGFSRVTEARVQRELARLLAPPVAARHPPQRSLRGLVLDLRDNRGGLLRQAVAVADVVLDGGLVATTAGRDPRADHDFRAQPGDLTEGLPIVVMIDGRSASAAEILAAALADDRRAVVVGSSSMGKGLVQTVTPMPDGGELFVTWSRVLAPRGWPIQGAGVLPQVCTSLGGEALRNQMNALADGRLLTAPELARHRALRPPVAAEQILDIRNTCPAAESSDADMRVAHFLLDRPAAYMAALLPP